MLFSISFSTFFVAVEVIVMSMTTLLFIQRMKGMLWFKVSIKSRGLRWKKVICKDLTVGEVIEIIIDPSNWKVTHLEVNLPKEAAELALGTRKGGI